MTSSDTGSDEELVREALDGLFEIAGEDRPASVQASLQEQIDEMPVDEARSLVEAMVDTDELTDRIRERRESSPRPVPRTPAARAGKVDHALEPLVAWTMGEEGTHALEAMDEEERFHVLFSSLGPAAPSQRA